MLLLYFILFKKLVVKEGLEPSRGAIIVASRHDLYYPQCYNHLSRLPEEYSFISATWLLSYKYSCIFLITKIFIVKSLPSLSSLSTSLTTHNPPKFATQRHSTPIWLCWHSLFCRHRNNRKLSCHAHDQPGSGGEQELQGSPTKQEKQSKLLTN